MSVMLSFSWSRIDCGYVGHWAGRK